MTDLFYDGMPVPIQPGESVLDALLNASHDIDYGCKSGSCQACMLTLETGELPQGSQPGLTPSQIELGNFLSCQCYPNSNEALYVRGEEPAIPCVPAVVTEKSFVGDSILRLRVRAGFYYQPGQYARLWKDANTSRTYSIASSPTLDMAIEFHIKVVSGGAFSEWAANELKVHSLINIQGPMGNCVYTRGTPEQPLLLAGLGTGLAPLYGIVRDALQQEHTGKIDLYIAVRRAANFYYAENLQALSQQHTNLNIHFISQTDQCEFSQQADIYNTIKSKHANLTSHKVYLCGAQSFVSKLKKQCYLAGAKQNNILADSFSAS